MKRSFKIYKTPQVLAETFAELLVARIRKAEKEKSTLTIAVSGGKTPILLFSVLANSFYGDVDWSPVKLFWVDERCVPPDDPESNFGITQKILLSRIKIPSSNIFRMRGEDDPIKEAARYSSVIEGNTRSINNFPVFDIIFLGMGDDGHTASIFPGQGKLLLSEKICEVSSHPVTGQNRITITAKVINNSDLVYFLVTGINKSEIISEIYRNSELSGNFPAAHISSIYGKTIWLLDNEAARFIV